MSVIQPGELSVIGVQSPVTSGQHRRNYDAIKNAHNELEVKVSGISTGTTNAETVAARPFNTDLGERLNQKGKKDAPIVIGGLIPSAQSVPNMTVQISVGTASINGIEVQTTSILNSATITAPTNERYDIVAMNSDNTITILTGNDSADPVLPAVSISQRPLSYIKLTSSTTTITNSIIFDISTQGCMVDGNWFFKIADAVTSIDSGSIHINKGDYYEQIIISGKSNISLIGGVGVNIFRRDDGKRCILSDNSIGNEPSNVVIDGISFFGNNQGGNLQLLFIDFCDNLIIKNCSFDGNANSTSTNKDFHISECENIFMTNIIAEDGEYFITSNTNYYFRNQTKIESDINATFDTVAATTMNTGQGDNELYAMNQDVLTSNTVVFDRLTATRGRTTAGSIRGSGVSYNSIFDAMKVALSVTNDNIIVTGSIRNALGGGEHLFATNALKVNSTTIRIFGIDIAGGITQVDAADGVGTTTTVGLAW